MMPEPSTFGGYAYKLTRVCKPQIAYSTCSPSNVNLHCLLLNVMRSLLLKCMLHVEMGLQKMTIEMCEMYSHIYTNKNIFITGNT